MDVNGMEKLLRAQLEAAAKIAEEEGAKLGEPAIGARIAKRIRELKNQ